MTTEVGDARGAEVQAPLAPRVRWLCGALVIGVAAWLCGCELPAYSNFQAGKELYDKREYDEAAQRLDKATRSLFLLGRVQLLLAASLQSATCATGTESRVIELLQTVDSFAPNLVDSTLYNEVRRRVDGVTVEEDLATSTVRRSSSASPASAAQ